ncbi:MAG: DUF5666 domain-containing protein [Acetobacteraceae bacterium]|nr:DUF5666 domain-containing protein [Acetobacteraceae bacterium]
MIRWLGPIAVALALASCVAPPAPPVAATADSVCRIGPDGGPVVADRGIGGTGAPVRAADRGIGGTGIVGVITGFASICVDGLEAALDPATRIDIDGSAGTVSALRVGQLVAVRADGPAYALRAREVSVRHEVSGPVQAVEVGSGALHVAGQRVVVPESAWGRGSVRLGDWATVSGLRAPDGSILATRIDPAPPGQVRVTGPLQEVDGVWRIGGLIVAAPPPSGASAGLYAVATGELMGDTLSDAHVVPDVMMANPPAFFAGADRLVLETFAHLAAQGIVALSGGFQVPAGPGFPRIADQSNVTVLWLDRGAGGGFTASAPPAFATPGGFGPIDAAPPGRPVSPAFRPNGGGSRPPLSKPPLDSPMPGMRPAPGGMPRPHGRRRERRQARAHRL